MSDVWQMSGVAAIRPLTSAYGDRVAVTREGGERFKQLLKEHRTALGLTQDDVAVQSGVSLSTINRWERGLVHNPEPEQIKAVCRVVRMSTVAAGIALGYLAPEDVEHLPEPPAPTSPTEEEAVAIIRDPNMTDAAKRNALAYLQFLRAQAEQPGTERSRAAS